MPPTKDTTPQKLSPRNCLRQRHQWPFHNLLSTSGVYERPGGTPKNIYIYIIRFQVRSKLDPTQKTGGQLLIFHFGYFFSPGFGSSIFNMEKSPLTVDQSPFWIALVSPSSFPKTWHTASFFRPLMWASNFIEFLWRLPKKIPMKLGCSMVLKFLLWSALRQRREWLVNRIGSCSCTALSQKKTANFTREMSPLKFWWIVCQILTWWFFDWRFYNLFCSFIFPVSYTLQYSSMIDYLHATVAPAPTAQSQHATERWVASHVIGSLANRRDRAFMWLLFEVELVHKVDSRPKSR